MQQNYARLSGVVEVFKIAELVRDALRLTEKGHLPSGIEIIQEMDDQLTVMLERHKVLQILVNLLRNARQACEASPHPEKQIRIKVTSDNGQLRIEISDNGVGISEENLQRIFAHGFTTKKNGHGFGLHSSEAAAKEMKGSLKVCSEGEGKGATFTLELPLQTNELRK